MKRPLLLDLFCGAGGAAVGYHRAGFEVVGVDSAPQPHYPFKFVQADAMTFDLDGFGAIHASPPCQGYSALRHMHADRLASHPRLIEPLRERLHAALVPYVIENVPGAPLEWPTLLCGSMFGLCVERGWLQRHRLFEASFTVPHLACDHPKDVRALGVYGEGTQGGWNCRASRAEAPELMGIDWMPHKSLVQAIPPAYTEYIGQYLMEAVTCRINDSEAA